MKVLLRHKSNVARDTPWQIMTRSLAPQSYQSACHIRESDFLQKSENNFISPHVRWQINHESVFQLRKKLARLEVDGKHCATIPAASVESSEVLLKTLLRLTKSHVPRPRDKSTQILFSTPNLLCFEWVFFLLPPPARKRHKSDKQRNETKSNLRSIQTSTEAPHKRSAESIIS